ncbi:PAS domain-containing protein [Halomicroarcula sp. GCM10025894]|uniref:PAS domain-containing protein n=1 Tax=Halomicroarcula sp. GCM10025894 TaxID=3252673 RepID=UPI003609EA0D
MGAAFFAVDDDWELTYWNHRAEEVLGRQAEDVMGEDLWEMFPDAVDATFYEAYHEAMATQEPADFEEYYPRSVSGSGSTPTPRRTGSRCTSTT